MTRFVALFLGATLGLGACIRAARCEDAIDLEKEVQAAALLMAQGPEAYDAQMTRLVRLVAGKAAPSRDVVLLWANETDPARLGVLYVLLADPMLPVLVPTFHSTMQAIVRAGEPAEKLPFALRNSGLSPYSDPQEVALVAPFLDHDSPECRASAVQALRSLDRESDDERFEQMAREDDSAMVRASALRGIRVEGGRSRFLDNMERAAKNDPDAGVRIVAFSLLGGRAQLDLLGGTSLEIEKLGKRYWRVFCRSAETDPDPQTRWTALASICSLWGKKALPALKYALEREKDDRVHENLALWVDHLEGKDVPLHPMLQTPLIPHFEELYQPYTFKEDQAEWARYRYAELDAGEGGGK